MFPHRPHPRPWTRWGRRGPRAATTQPLLPMLRMGTQMRSHPHHRRHPLGHLLFLTRYKTPIRKYLRPSYC